MIGSCAKTALAAKQDHHFIDYMGTQVRSHVVDVVWRTDRVDVDCNDVEAHERTNEINAFAGGQAAPRR